MFVEFFFVLSGFVLYPQLMKVLNNKKNLITFYKRRWLRTIPLYLVITAAVSVLTNNMFSFDFFKYLIFIQKIFPNFISNDYFPVAWSLSIEEIFYLTFPLILISLNKSNFLFYTFGLILFFIALKLFSSSYVDANFLRTGSILRLDAILIGFVLAHYKKIIIYQKIKIIILNFALLLFYLLNYKNFMSGTNSPYVSLTFITLLQIISSFTIFSFIYLENLIKKLKIKNLCLLISRQTYSIYLTHIIFIYILSDIQFPTFLSIIIYITTLFITSSIIYRYFEKPFLSLRPKLN